jgi:DNA-binding IclR family transcriptional regulator
MPSRSRRTEGTQAITRAIEILRAVARVQRGGATLSKVIRATDLSRSTAFRLLRCLTQERLLHFDEEQRVYCIGPLAYELGLAGKGQADIVANWHAHIARVSAKTGLTTYLVARSDTEVVCLDTVQGTSVVRAVPLIVGQRLPLGIGAGSLAILSSLPDEEVEAVIASNTLKLPMYGDGRLTPAKLRQRVEMTRANGFAYSRESVAKGISGVGVTIQRHGDLAQIAISVSLVGTQLDANEQSRLVNTIRDAAQF